MRNNLMTLATVATICLAISGLMFSSCNKIDEMEGMNASRANYSYRASSVSFDYSDACGPFDIAIKSSVGLDPFLRGDDGRVIDAIRRILKNTVFNQP